MLAEPIMIISQYIYVNQAIMLYPLKLYIDVFQLFFNKTKKISKWEKIFFKEFFFSLG